MNGIHLSGLIVEPITERIRVWNVAGKISEEDLENALSEDARTLIDHSIAEADWVSLDDVESLVGLVAEQIGGETGLVEWADEIVLGWREKAVIQNLVKAGRSLTDSPGFVVSQASALFLRDADWHYDGGRSSFNVRLGGMGELSPALKALIGALLARLAIMPTDLDFDVRFDGVDGGDLVVFCEIVGQESNEGGEGRLHQAALIA
jgi:hypothetical protein